MKEDHFTHAPCGLTRAVGRIGSKWKPIILHVIGHRSLRFGQLDAFIPCITRKVLTDHLKELEQDGLIERRAFRELPPRVEYKLSRQGLLFLPILQAMQAWNADYEAALQDQLETGV